VVCGHIPNVETHRALDPRSRSGVNQLLVACAASVRAGALYGGLPASKSALDASVRSWRDIGLILAGDGTSQPSISRTVIALEARLGVKVFLRTTGE
jgi:hypothetical protein